MFEKMFVQLPFSLSARWFHPLTRAERKLRFRQARIQSVTSRRPSNNCEMLCIYRLRKPKCIHWNKAFGIVEYLRWAHMQCSARASQFADTLSTYCKSFARRAIYRLTANSGIEAHLDANWTLSQACTYRWEKVKFFSGCRSSRRVLQFALKQLPSCVRIVLTSGVCLTKWVINRVSLIERNNA